jgi:hypothetical protein
MLEHDMCHASGDVKVRYCRHLEPGELILHEKLRARLSGECAS